MPSNHKGQPTISFRLRPWQRALIEERAKLSGMSKNEFIVRSCIYSHICLVGKKENIQAIVDKTHNMAVLLNETTDLVKAGDFCIEDDSYIEMKRDFLAFLITLTDILNGAAHLWENDPSEDSECRREDAVNKLSLL